jgi:hypothetical protein
LAFHSTLRALLPLRPGEISMKAVSIGSTSCPRQMKSELTLWLRYNDHAS